MLGHSPATVHSIERELVKTTLAVVHLSSQYRGFDIVSLSPLVVFGFLALDSDFFTLLFSRLEFLWDLAPLSSKNRFDVAFESRSIDQGEPPGAGFVAQCFPNAAVGFVECLLLFEDPLDVPSGD